MTAELQFPPHAPLSQAGARLVNARAQSNARYFLQIVINAWSGIEKIAREPPDLVFSIS
jgi:hypothetical protein